jgi:hypothetical protein
VRVEADQCESRPGSGEPRRLGVEWSEVGEVLVDQAGDDEVVGSRIEAGARHLALAKRAVHAPSPRRLEHPRREVDRVDLPDSPSRQPAPGPPSPTPKIRRGANVRPIHLEPLEQRQIHRVLDRVFISSRPPVVPLPRRDGPVATGVKGLE